MADPQHSRSGHDDVSPGLARRPGRSLLIWLVGAVVFLAVVLVVYNRTKTEQREEVLAPAQVERGDVGTVGNGG